MFRFFKLAALSVICFSTVGCASLMTSNENNVRVETVDSTGVEIKDANCAILRGSLRSEFKTPAVVPVTKGSSDVRIDCTKEGFPEGRAVVTSRVGGATFGNILAGGIIGAVVDQSTGKAYNFPDWIQIVMGKVLAFDRKNHVDGKPTAGTVIETPASGVAAALNPKTDTPLGAETQKPKEEPKK
jgi:hypothetical protein